MKMEKEVVNRISTLVTSAFGFVAALAWNSAIQRLFSEIFPVDKDNLIAMFSYAILVTVAAVIATYYILNFSPQIHKKSKKK